MKGRLGAVADFITLLDYLHTLDDVAPPQLDLHVDQIGSKLLTTFFGGG